MMRGASRIATRSVSLPVPSCGVAATLTASQRCFGSKYSDDLGSYRRPYATESRSGAHRHPPRKEVLSEQRAAAAKSRPIPEEDVEAVAPPSSPKNHYPEYYKKKRDERLAFTSNFREPDMKPILNAVHTQSPSRPQHRMGVAETDLDDSDVTRIYSKEEVRNMARETGAEPRPVMTAAADEVLNAMSAENATPKAAAAQQPVTEELDSADMGDDADEFAEIRSHPFFMDMLRRVERNMIRFRKETRSTGRYSVEAVNECVRPLLQLTDYPLTASQLSHLSHSISPAVLKSSLRDRSACRRLQLYRSQDTDLLLDWSVEDFLRRRYESVHLSWEPMDIICRRFGWTPEMLSDRDYLLYFSAFPEYVELAELQTTAKGEPKAVPIVDPVARATEAPIPANRLLLRRKASADAEPSLTESIRLMGSPAVNTPVKGKKAQRMRQHGGDSVVDYFNAVETAASDVDGDEAVKLQHAAETVRPLRQASHPGGRTIREFSLPKSHSAPSKPAGAAAATAPETPVSAVAAGAKSDEIPFDQKRFEELSNAYHNAKVENSLLRRRMLATDSVDKAQELQAELAKGRREVVRLEQELERMRELKRHTAVSSAAAMASFHVPRGLPQYAEAPEFDDIVTSKNASAVEDIDDDEIERALKDYKDEEELVMHGKTAPARAAAYTATSTAPNAAADEDEYEEVEVEVDDEDGDLTAAEDVAREEQVGAAADVFTSDVEAVSSKEPLVEAATMEHDQQWQDELEAAVEQHETEVDEDEDFSAALHSTTTANTPSSRLKQLASLHDRLSSAADRARHYLATVEKRRTEVLEKLASQLADANKRVERLEEQLTAVEKERTALQDVMAREEAERKAREVEVQLKAQREKRMAELEQQRERARLAQEEAARAVERQRAVEREAMAMEEELQRKLRDVQSRLRSLKEGDEENQPQALSAAPKAAETKKMSEDAAAVPTRAQSAESATLAPAAATATAPLEEEEMLASPVTTGQFMCTPEQYDGLHLAADRLKKEIAALEAQMEEEGDEDDETLMAVLAASRADLEELEECIGSVQANATWAATRDAKLAREHKLSAQVADTEAHRLQSSIDNHRFQISLLEKRLHHTSQKTVMAKLKDRIAQNRKSISQLRLEQDRLRRAGRDALGLPASVSIAETLAHEGKDADEAKLAEEEHAAAAATDDLESMPAVEEDVDATSDAELGGDGGIKEWQRNAKNGKEARAAGAVGGDPTTTPSSDADKLRLRLDSMVGDIQHLQDSIEAQERSYDYDDEETEVVLREMKEKLSQLLRLRDQVQRALVEESANGPAVTSGSTPIIRPAAESASAAPLVGRAAMPVRSGPALSQYAREANIPSASKKLRSATRSSATYRRR
ncbi:hypothetical protein ABL78_6983 [Leptomonas seymouri]|uniref:Uncharacterized protein n=1 Tax=Leptomonas seymouri TaxID=5684 RepID=A0A0N1I2M3_LEPSE|nr:hypothetical protein ABL78_6983 [Leptomonas seymouri]|eukprot:KPI83972.1 hypothetical protein ABL78_6983 [Leptomonas seymouri]